MLKKIVLIFLFCSRLTTAQNWERQNSGVKNVLLDVAFIDTSNGIAVGEQGTILRTIDGGKNWVLQNSTTANALLKVNLISKDIAFIVGSNGTILKTTNGGNSWISLNESIKLNFRDLSFISENEGWIAGRLETASSGIGAIIHTTDGGKTFIKQIEIESTDPANVKYFQAVKFVDQFNGWALASDYFDNFSPTFLYGTKDGGNNWKIVNIINSIPILDIKPINKDTLWIGGGSSAKLVKTFDGGITLSYSFLDTVFAQEIAPQSGLQGWISHRKPYNFLDYNKIMFTRDGGITWKEEYRVKETVGGMCTLNNYLWLVGTDGLILKKTPLISSVKETQEIFSEQKIQLQNYPNPFNLQTIISYEITSQSDIEVIIYNVIGEIIERKNYYSKLPGKYDFEWQGKDEFGKQLPSGIYLCNLNIIDSKKMYRTNTIKMLLIK